MCIGEEPPTGKLLADGEEKLSAVSPKDVGGIIHRLVDTVGCACTTSAPQRSSRGLYGRLLKQLGISPAVCGEGVFH